MSWTAKDLLSATATRGKAEAPVSRADDAAAEWRLAAATIGLSVAAVAAPITVAMIAATNAQLLRVVVISLFTSHLHSRLQHLAARAFCETGGSRGPDARGASPQTIRHVTGDLVPTLAAACSCL